MISAVVLTKNEATNITRCLKSVNWCDEVIVLDDNSVDDTVEIAQRNGAKVVTKTLTDFSSQRNFALELAKNEWIFFVDADEVVSGNLKKEIQKNILNSKGITGFFLKRNDFIWNKKINFGDGKDLSFLRLARKDSGKWVGAVHEVWKVKGEKQKLNSPLEHYPHQAIKEFLREINFYSDLRSNELYEKGIMTNFLEIILYTKGKFISNYFLKLGILDGVEGLILALMMSFYTFLTRSKLYFLWQNQKRT